MRLTVIPALDDGSFDGSCSIGSAGMNAGPAGLGVTREGTQAGRSTVLGRLDSHGLAHDRASVGEDLQLGHGAAAGRSLGAGGRRESTESGGGGRFHERAHGLGLADDGVHDGQIDVGVE